MHIKKILPLLLIILSTFFAFAPNAIAAAKQPVSIFHAFNQNYNDVENFVCELADQGYSHLQISPAQESNSSTEWWARYQPIDYSVIKGKGSEQDLKNLINKAHSCNVKVIADVVFNHMADLDGGSEFENLNKFPGLSKDDFQTVSSDPGKRNCEISEFNGYNDGNRNRERDCWLGGTPDLKFTTTVKDIQKAHLKKLIDLEIDGFRFDAAKHMPNEVVQDYINYIDREDRNMAWNYLEVISDGDTRAEDYNNIAAVTDFVLYNSMKDAFSFGGDLRSLRIPKAVDDRRSVTFGRNHDNLKEINQYAIGPYNNASDSYFATAYVLARESGTPLVLNWDNKDVSFIRSGVKFRQIITQRGEQGKDVKENVITVIDSPTVLLMERGSEGFFAVNKGANKFDIPELDLTLTKLDGCYRELRNNFTVAIERRNNNKKYLTRWGTWNRGGMEVQARDALYFIREPFNQCSAS